MRILSVATMLPYPPDHAARLRVWNLLKRATSWAEVTLLTWHEGPAPAPEVADRVARMISAPVRSIPMDGVTRALRWGRALSGGPPPWIQAVREERQGPWAREVVALHRERPFDLVVAQEDAAGALLPPVDAPTLLHRENVFSRTLRDLRHGPRMLGWPLEAPVWRRFDATASQGDVAVVPTEEMARMLASVVPGVRTAVVPNGVEVPPEPLDPSAGAGVVFIGTMDYAPNVQAVRWFRRRVWDDVRRTVPEARLRVIGRGGPERLTSGDGVEIVGYAPDLLEACAGARAGVVPLRAGVGIKTKTLELLGMGLPVVATPAGAEGIPPNDGLLVAESPDGLRDAVAGLLADPDEAEHRGRVGRKLVRERFGWDAAADAYRRTLLDAAAAGREATR